MDFHGMKRKELQKLCKVHNIPANLTNLEMANRLTSLLKERDKPIARGRSCLKNSVEMVGENDSDSVDRQKKKVRFSPDAETFEFIKSEVKPTRAGRRKSMRISVNSKEDTVAENVDSNKSSEELLEKNHAVRVTRSRARRSMEDREEPFVFPNLLERKRAKRVAKVVNQSDKPPDAVELSENVASESAVNEVSRMPARRSTRSTTVSDNEGDKDVGVAVSRKSKRQRSPSKSNKEESIDGVSIVPTLDKDGGITQPSNVSRRSNRNGSKIEDTKFVKADLSENEMVGISVSKKSKGKVNTNKSNKGEPVDGVPKNQTLATNDVSAQPANVLRRSTRSQAMSEDTESVKPDLSEKDIVGISVSMKSKETRQKKSKGKAIGEVSENQTLISQCEDTESVKPDLSKKDIVGISVSMKSKKEISQNKSKGKAIGEVSENQPLISQSAYILRRSDRNNAKFDGTESVKVGLNEKEMVGVSVPMKNKMEMSPKKSNEKAIDEVPENKTVVSGIIQSANVLKRSTRGSAKISNTESGKADVSEKERAGTSVSMKSKKDIILKESDRKDNDEVSDKQTPVRDAGKTQPASALRRSNRSSTKFEVSDSVKTDMTEKAMVGILVSMKSKSDKSPKSSKKVDDEFSENQTPVGDVGKIQPASTSDLRRSTRSSTKFEDHESVKAELNELDAGPSVSGKNKRQVSPKTSDRNVNDEDSKSKALVNDGGITHTSNASRRSNRNQTKAKDFEPVNMDVNDSGMNGRGRSTRSRTQLGAKGSELENNHTKAEVGVQGVSEMVSPLQKPSGNPGRNSSRKKSIMLQSAGEVELPGKPEVVQQHEETLKDSSRNGKRKKSSRPQFEEVGSDQPDNENEKSKKIARKSLPGDESDVTKENEMVSASVVPLRRSARKSSEAHDGSQAQANLVADSVERNMRMTRRRESILDKGTAVAESSSGVHLRGRQSKQSATKSEAVAEAVSSGITIRKKKLGVRSELDPKEVMALSQTSTSAVEELLTIDSPLLEQKVAEPASDAVVSRSNIVSEITEKIPHKQESSSESSDKTISLEKAGVVTLQNSVESSISKAEMLQADRAGEAMEVQIVTESSIVTEKMVISPGLVLENNSASQPTSGTEGFNGKNLVDPEPGENLHAAIPAGLADLSFKPDSNVLFDQPSSIAKLKEVESEEKPPLAEVTHSCGDVVTCNAAQERTPAHKVLDFAQAEDINGRPHINEDVEEDLDAPYQNTSSEKNSGHTSDGAGVPVINSGGERLTDLIHENRDTEDGAIYAEGDQLQQRMLNTDTEAEITSENNFPSFGEKQIQESELAVSESNENDGNDFLNSGPVNAEEGYGKGESTIVVAEIDLTSQSRDGNDGVSVDVVCVPPTVNDEVTVGTDNILLSQDKDTSIHEDSVTAISTEEPLPDSHALSSNHFPEEFADDMLEADNLSSMGMTSLTPIVVSKHQEYSHSDEDLSEKSIKEQNNGKTSSHRDEFSDRSVSKLDTTECDTEPEIFDQGRIEEDVNPKQALPENVPENRRASVTPHEETDDILKENEYIGKRSPGSVATERRHLPFSEDSREGGMTENVDGEESKLVVPKGGKDTGDAANGLNLLLATPIHGVSKAGEAVEMLEASGGELEKTSHEDYAKGSTAEDTMEQEAKENEREDQVQNPCADPVTGSPFEKDASSCHQETADTATAVQDQLLNQGEAPELVEAKEEGEREESIHEKGNELIENIDITDGSFGESRQDELKNPSSTPIKNTSSHEEKERSTAHGTEVTIGQSEEMVERSGRECEKSSNELATSTSSEEEISGDGCTETWGDDQFEDILASPFSGGNSFQEEAFDYAKADDQFTDAVIPAEMSIGKARDARFRQGEPEVALPNNDEQIAVEVSNEAQDVMQATDGKTAVASPHKETEDVSCESVKEVLVGSDDVECGVSENLGDGKEDETFDKSSEIKPASSEATEQHKSNSLETTPGLHEIPPEGEPDGHRDAGVTEEGDGMTEVVSADGFDQDYGNSPTCSPKPFHEDYEVMKEEDVVAMGDPTSSAGHHEEQPAILEDALEKGSDIVCGGSNKPSNCEETQDDAKFDEASISYKFEKPAEVQNCRDSSGLDPNISTTATPSGQVSMEPNRESHGFGDWDMFLRENQDDEQVHGSTDDSNCDNIGEDVDKNDANAMLFEEENPVEPEHLMEEIEPPRENHHLSVACDLPTSEHEEILKESDVDDIIDEYIFSEQTDISIAVEKSPFMMHSDEGFINNNLSVGERSEEKAAEIKLTGPAFGPNPRNAADYSSDFPDFSIDGGIAAGDDRAAKQLNSTASLPKKLQLMADMKENAPLGREGEFGSLTTLNSTTTKKRRALEDVKKR